MAVGGPLMVQNLKDQAVSVAPGRYVTHVEARSASFGGVKDQSQVLSTWWASGTGGPQTLAGHYA